MPNEVSNEKTTAPSFRIDREGGRLVLHGTLCAATAAEAWRRLDSATSGAGGPPPWLDLSEAKMEDDAAVALLSLVASRGVHLDGLDAATSEAVRRAREAADARPIGGAPAAPGFFEGVGRATVNAVSVLHGSLGYVGRLAFGIPAALVRPASGALHGFASIFERVGANAVPVTLLIGFLLGLILAFESALPLGMFGAEVYVGNLIGIAVVRELAVLVAAIVMAGRTASAFAAELGTMVVGDEVSALRTMGIDPVLHLAVPRVLAAGCALPLLSLFAGLAGLVGGYVVLAIYGYSLPVYLEHARSFCHLHDVLGALAKAFVFGLLIGGVGCRRGLSTGGGSDAVGAATTSAVVGAIVIFAIADGVFAILYHVLGV